jgi:arylsulfatase A
MKFRRLLIITIIAFVAHLANANGKVKDRPNIILIMSDDQGSETVGCYGITRPYGSSSNYKTPNLDRLASEGIRFDHAYSTPICSPSRNQIMSGAYNFRNYESFGSLNPGIITIGQLMKNAGYATAIAGKWQLSGGEGWNTPRAVGFDESCMWAYGFDLENMAGFHLHKGGEGDTYYYDPNNPDRRYNAQLTERPHMTSRYWYPSILKNDRFLKTTYEDYGPNIFTDFVNNFIEKHQDEPFFVYYPMALPHGPYVPPPGFEKEENKFKSNFEKHYPQMVNYADQLVGRIENKLKELNLLENTIIIYTGDNGTPTEGGKGTSTDGGTHVPFIISWPGTAPRGEVLDDLVDFTDIFPTLADAANVEIPRFSKVDGVSFFPQIKGEKGNLRKWAFCWWDKNPASIRENAKFEPSIWIRTQRYKLYHRGLFYDIQEDPLELAPLDTRKLKGKEKEAYEMLIDELTYISADYMPTPRFRGLQQSVED